MWDTPFPYQSRGGNNIIVSYMENMATVYSIEYLHGGKNRYIEIQRRKAMKNEESWNTFAVKERILKELSHVVRSYFDTHTDRKFKALEMLEFV